jgi:pimeloyl-ACP methyl ester carboxylesterase
LHGFASSPNGNKVRFYREKLRKIGIELHAPDLNTPDFEHMTLTAIISKIAEVTSSLQEGPVYLIGSSMGGLAALHFYDHYRKTAARNVRKILFLAPAFTLFSRLDADSEGELSVWRSTGTMQFFHYGYQENRSIRYDIVADAEQYDTYSVKLDIPALIYHGLQDEDVPPTQSIRFAETRPNVTLRLVESDHRLRNVLDDLWTGTVNFFELTI